MSTHRYLTRVRVRKAEEIVTRRVRVEIDEQALAQSFVSRLFRNKSKKSKLADGAIIAERIDEL